MIRRVFVSRMAAGALACMMLREELLGRVVGNAEAASAAATFDKASIRNVVRVQWSGGDVLVEDMASVVEYGRRVVVLNFDHDPAISTQRAAQKLAERVLADHSAPRDAL